jgi:hypothetical protein
LDTADDLDVNKVLRPTFTDRDLLRAPESRVCCQSCSAYFDHQELRRENWWLAAKHAETISRKAIRPYIDRLLAEPLPESGYFLVTTAKRKHIGLRAPLNVAGNRHLKVQFELATLEIDASRWSLLTAACDTLRRHHTWQEITGDGYQSWRLAKWQDAIDEFAAARDAIRPFLRTPYLDLVQFCGDLAAKEEEDAD